MRERAPRSNQDIASIINGALTKLSAGELLDRIVRPEPLLPLKEHVEAALSSLTDREREVVRSRFGLVDGHSKTLTEVGKEIGRSRWTVGRIERRALAKLHAPANSQSLRDALT